MASRFCESLERRYTCFPVITMNPGYAGRSMLPDAVEMHFRPVSMQIPDVQVTAEVMLACEAIVTAKELSGKLTGILKAALAQKTAEAQEAARVIAEMQQLIGSLEEEVQS